MNTAVTVCAILCSIFILESITDCIRDCIGNVYTYRGFPYRDVQYESICQRYYVVIKAIAFGLELGRITMAKLIVLNVYCTDIYLYILC
jgi:hypothetical protein